MEEVFHSWGFDTAPRAHLTLKQVAANFRKTATNFHYEFNIRHLSNVFQGLLVAQPDQFKTAEKFVHLWMHESERVYGDRLVRLERKLHLAQEYTNEKKLMPRSFLLGKGALKPSESNYLEKQVP